MNFWMRLFQRLAKWCESHRVVRQNKFDAQVERIDKLTNDQTALLLLRNLQQRMDHIELFVGMKRQKQTAAPGTPNIT